MKKTIILVTLGALVCGAGYWYWTGAARPSTTFRTFAVERGDLLATINATGTIEPEEVVDVGAQVGGRIKNFGQDLRDTNRPIDYGSPVEEGTVLAQIDDSLYQAQENQAKANLQRTEADLLQFQAKFAQADRDFKRLRNLRSQAAASQEEYDSALAAIETARSAVAVGEASISQARAAHRQAEINLGYCTIKSPVKGVIVDRRVNVGQTVVASLNSPSLFLIAKDLKRLQVWASVNEADVGNIHSGQAIHFTVDAFPGEVFGGVVAPDQPRLNASMTQNVVTYTVVVNTENANGKLLPYLTANLQFEVGQHRNVLMVSNAALRWQPAPQQVAEDARATFIKTLQRAGRPASDPTLDPAQKGQQDRGMVWIEDQGFVRPVPVRIGLSDGAHTEVSADGLSEGDRVVVGESQPDTGGGTSNPFAPQPFGGKRQ